MHLAIDGDGDLDLIASSTGDVTGFVSVVFNPGNGVFGTSVDYNIMKAVRDIAVGDLGVAFSRLIVADVNGDGVPDLAGETAGLTPRTVLLTGNGDATFTSAGTLPAAPGGLVAVADLDRVAPVDLVGRLGVIYRAGSAMRTDDWPMLALDVRDITGDGHPDVIGVGFSVQAGPRSNAVFALTSQCR